jgi:hypothetical protein
MRLSRGGGRPEKEITGGKATGRGGGEERERPC